MSKWEQISTAGHTEGRFDFHTLPSIDTEAHLSISSLLQFSLAAVGNKRFLFLPAVWHGAADAKKWGGEKRKRYDNI